MALVLLFAAIALAFARRARVVPRLAPQVRPPSFVTSRRSASTIMDSRSGHSRGSLSAYPGSGERQHGGLVSSLLPPGNVRLAEVKLMELVSGGIGADADIAALDLGQKYRARVHNKDEAPFAGTSFQQGARKQSLVAAYASQTPDEKSTKSLDDGKAIRDDESEADVSKKKRPWFFFRGKTSDTATSESTDLNASSTDVSASSSQDTGEELFDRLGLGDLDEPRTTEFAKALLKEEAKINLGEAIESLDTDIPHIFQRAPNPSIYARKFVLDNSNASKILFERILGANSGGALVRRASKTRGLVLNLLIARALRRFRKRFVDTESVIVKNRRLHRQGNRVFIEYNWSANLEIRDTPFVRAASTLARLLSWTSGVVESTNTVSIEAVSKFYPNRKGKIVRHAISIASATINGKAFDVGDLVMPVLEPEKALGEANESVNAGVRGNMTQLDPASMNDDDLSESSLDAVIDVLPIDEGPTLDDTPISSSSASPSGESEDDSGMSVYEEPFDAFGLPNDQFDDAKTTEFARATRTESSQIKLAQAIDSLDKDIPNIFRRTPNRYIYTTDLDTDISAASAEVKRILEQVLKVPVFRGAQRVRGLVANLLLARTLRRFQKLFVAAGRVKVRTRRLIREGQNVSIEYHWFSTMKMKPTFFQRTAAQLSKMFTRESFSDQADNTIHIDAVSKFYANRKGIIYRHEVSNVSADLNGKPLASLDLDTLLRSAGLNFGGAGVKSEPSGDLPRSAEAFEHEAGNHVNESGLESATLGSGETPTDDDLASIDTAEEEEPPEDDSSEAAVGAAAAASVDSYHPFGLTENDLSEETTSEIAKDMSRVGSKMRLADAIDSLDEDLPQILRRAPSPYIFTRDLVLDNSEASAKLLQRVMRNTPGAILNRAGKVKGLTSNLLLARALRQFRKRFVESDSITVSQRRLSSDMGNVSIEYHWNALLHMKPTVFQRAALLFKRLATGSADAQVEQVVRIEATSNFYPNAKGKIYWHTISSLSVDLNGKPIELLDLEDLLFPSAKDEHSEDVTGEPDEGPSRAPLSTTPVTAPSVPTGAPALSESNRSAAAGAVAMASMMAGASGPA